MASEWSKAVQAVRAMKVNNPGVWLVVRKWYDGAQNYHDIKASTIVNRFFLEIRELAIERLEDE